MNNMKTKDEILKEVEVVMEKYINPNVAMHMAVKLMY